MLALAAVCWHDITYYMYQVNKRDFLQEEVAVTIQGFSPGRTVWCVAAGFVNVDVLGEKSNPYCVFTYTLKYR